MLIIKLLVFGLFAFGVFRAVTALSRAVERDHQGYRSFTKKCFIVITGGYFFILCGVMWRQHSMAVHGDTSNGTVLALVGAAMLGSVIYQHIRGTSLGVGLGISAVQLPLFAVLAYFGSALFLIGGMLFLVMPSVVREPQYVRIIN